MSKFGLREAKRSADDWQHELVLAVERGTATDPRNTRMKFDAWAAAFQVSQAPSLRGNTRAQHAHIFKNHLVPALGKLRLDEITQRSIQTAVDDLVAKGLSANTVRLCYQILNKTLAGAVQAQMLSRNPCRDIMLPERVHRDMRFLTPEEVSKLAGVIEPQYSALVMLGAYGGLRISELAGLKWSRVDFNASAVQVSEILVEVKGRVAFGPPKTRRSTRRVPIPSAVTDLLRAHQEQHGGTDDLVFHASQGGWITPSAWRARTFNPAAVRAGLAPLTPHALRHTAVSIWISANVSPAEIALRAGHASAAFVLDRYGHLFPHGDEAFSDRVGRLYVPPT